MRKARRTWLIWVVVIAIVVFVAVDHFTGYEVIGAATRLVWNGVAFIVNSLWRAGGELAAAIARAIGMRRAARVASALAGVGLGYAGSVILSDEKIHRAHTWRDRLRVVITRIRNAWVDLHLVWKLVIVAALIASQVYLHFLLIVFPVAFLVPVVRRAWIVAGDTLFGSLYRRKMTRVHRAVRRALWRTPGYPQLVDAVRLLRMRYLCAWRRWRYDTSYRDAASGAREVSLVEPVRLWWRGELDRYRERPLLAGGVAPSREDRVWRPPAKARDVAPPHRTRRHGSRVGAAAAIEPDECKKTAAVTPAKDDSDRTREREQDRA